MTHQALQALPLSSSEYHQSHFLVNFRLLHLIRVARAMARTVVGALLTLFQPLLYWALLTLVPSCLMPVSPLPKQWQPDPSKPLPVPVDSKAPKIKAAGHLTAVSVLKVSTAMSGAIPTSTVISAGLSAGIGTVATGANLGLREEDQANL